jgi:hypothetical protein
MTLKEQIRDYCNAGFSGLWVQTQEIHEADSAIAQLCEEEEWLVSVWDCARGDWKQPGTGAGKPEYPLSKKFNPTGIQRVLVLLWNYHLFVKNPMVLQQLQHCIIEGKSDRIHWVILSPLVVLGPELEKLFVVIEHELPSEAELGDICWDLSGVEESDRAGRFEVAGSAVGMTRYEAEGAFALSLTRKGNIEAEVVWNLKCEALKKSGLLTLHRGKESFKDLGGMKALKDFCRKAIEHANGVKPRGIMLLGPSGTGKSQFCKALGNETRRPVLLADPGSWKSPHVGETGQKTRAALKVADAMAPCILFIDEVEKALAGASSEHQGDSGVSADQLGALLTWLNDHESDVFVVCTCNDISKLPPEFCRAERWDGIFFIDLPGESERLAIWNLYGNHYGHTDASWSKVESTDWTGAEIKSCCRLAKLLGVPLEEAAKQVIPVNALAGEKVQALREWASGRCVSANTGTIYHHEENKEPRQRRSVKARSDATQR